MFRQYVLALTLGVIATEAFAGLESVGPKGINAIGLEDFNGDPLTGEFIDIGQVESLRAGISEFDNAANCCEPSTVPDEAYHLDHVATQNEALSPAHAIRVAGVMISTNSTARGVATQARLQSSAFTSSTIDDQSAAAISSQYLFDVTTVNAINMSFGLPLLASSLNGDSLLTSFIDWSATQHDILYVVAGNELGTPQQIPVPTDEYNGLTVAQSSKFTDGVYRSVALSNDYSLDATGARTSIDILAPGIAIALIGPNGTPAVDNGTSYAAPHVTGTIALLQQYASERVDNGGWNPQSRRHEVMKATIMNAADKIRDTGDGQFLGMSRTVLRQSSTTDDWLDSPAFTDDTIPLDEQMGTGHLNAKRAVQQFAAGEHNFDTGEVPLVGWDYGLTDGQDEFNKYVLDTALPANQFVSLTLAWDRDVFFETDDGTPGAFDDEDSFLAGAQPIDLNLYLMEAGETDVSNAVAKSIATDSSVEHIFFEVANTGMYEIWGGQDSGGFAQQTYALAWWMEAIFDNQSFGDYSGNGTVGSEDYTIWKMNFGTANASADGEWKRNR